MSTTKRDRFNKPEGGYSFPRLEERILKLWEDKDVFAKSLEKPAPRGSWVFFEGPPTANNMPHPGHVLTRVVKDCLPRFKTMQGHYVRRQGGWDTHGLPVELSVEAELFNAGELTERGPRAILEYGMEKFNRRCFDSVRRYEQEWVKLSSRVGYWLDYENAYFTFSNKYIESVWWLLKTIYDRGLMYRGHRIQWYSTLIGTGLSSHEVAQNYQVVKDPSATVRSRVVPGQQVGGFTATEHTYLLLWTTTPWTLISNVALCVNPEFDYVVVEFNNEAAERTEHLLLSEGLLEKNGLDAETVVARVKGSALAGLKYERLYTYDIPDISGSGSGIAADSGSAGAEHAFAHPEATRNDHRRAEASSAPAKSAWYVIADEYVTLADGTGVVHIAPAFGEDDYRLGQANNLPVLNAMDSEGKALGTVAVAPGKWFKDVDPPVLADLKARGLLFASAKYEHNYPHCYRTDAPLMSYPLESWFIKMSDPTVKAQLLAGNEQIYWQPGHIKHGRFGDWLGNVVDWSLSRDRFWGTPLPVWECNECTHQQCIGSYAELKENCPDRFLDVTDVYDQSQFNPHRPFIDDYDWSCTECDGGTMKRVRFVIDCWFDAGSMPFAQVHYPFENREMVEGGTAVTGGTEAAATNQGGFTGAPTNAGDRRQFPADFISEAIDQTRGWFYTLHAISTLITGGPAYKSCLVMGHILDEKGRKMSKRLGNVVDPWKVINEFGADAFRWYFYASGNLTSGARFSEKGVLEGLQRFIIPLWNVYSFFTIYANLDDFDPAAAQLSYERLTELDRWILLKLNRLKLVVAEHLDALRISDAAKACEEFLGELSNWYVRRSRRRFWQPEQDDAKLGAYQTLYSVLTQFSRLLAPFMPFIAEELHQQLVVPFDADAPVSVHLCEFPEHDAGFADQQLEYAMDQALRVCSLGHAARKESRLRVRQPLSRVTLVTRDPGLREAVDSHADIVMEELNVKQLAWASDETEFVDYQYKPNFRLLGPLFGERAKRVAAWFADAAEVTRQLDAHRGQPVAVEVPIGDYGATRGTEVPRSDWPASDERAGDSESTETQWHNWVELDLDGERVQLDARYFEVLLLPRAEIVAQRDGGLLLALNTHVDEALRQEGLAREVVHKLQARRKELDLPYDARIRVTYSADAELAAAIEAHRAYVQGETLATELVAVDALGEEHHGQAVNSGEIDGQQFAFAVEVV